MMTVKLRVSQIRQDNADTTQTIAFFAEGLLLVIACIMPPTNAELLRISLLLICSGGHLFTEYRLNVLNLVTSIRAMVLAGVARALWQTIARY
jgi:hypothetical protein